MSITKRQLIGAGYRARGQAFEDAADQLLFALRAGYADNPAAIADTLRAIARSCFEEGDHVLTGASVELAGRPTYLPGVKA